MIRWQSNRQHNRYITHVRANMKRREDRAVREVMKRLLRSNLRFHKTDCGRFGAMTAWGLKDTSSRPAKDLGGTLRHTYITNLLYAGVDPKTVQYVTVNEVNSNQKFDLIRKSILSILQTKNAYDIMPVGKMIRLNSFITQQKPQSCDLWGFFIPFGQGGLFPQAGYQLLFSIQPFANVVGDYTCQDRKHKW